MMNEQIEKVDKAKIDFHTLCLPERLFEADQWSLKLSMRDLLVLDIH